MAKLFYFHFQLLTIQIVNRFVVKICSRMKTQRHVNWVRIYYTHIRNVVILTIRFSSFFKEKRSVRKLVNILKKRITIYASKSCTVR